MIYILTFDAFSSDVKVQVEAEDTAMMQQLKPDDFVCFRLSVPFDTYIRAVVNSPFSHGFIWLVQCLMLLYTFRLLCWMRTGRMSYLSRLLI
jgi:hypothetical protein